MKFLNAKGLLMVSALIPSLALSATNATSKKQTTGPVYNVNLGQTTSTPANSITYSTNTTTLYTPPTTEKQKNIEVSLSYLKNTLKEKLSNTIATNPYYYNNPGYNMTTSSQPEMAYDGSSSGLGLKVGYVFRPTGQLTATTSFGIAYSSLEEAIPLYQMNTNNNTINDPYALQNKVSGSMLDFGLTQQIGYDMEIGAQLIIKPFVELGIFKGSLKYEKNQNQNYSPYSQYPYYGTNNTQNNENDLSSLRYGFGIGGQLIYQNTFFAILKYDMYTGSRDAISNNSVNNNSINYPYDQYPYGSYPTNPYPTTAQEDNESVDFDYSGLSLGIGILF